MMQMTDDELLELYRRRRDDAAFGELTRRYINLVHAAALRQTRDPHLADDVTQAVFIVLARRAGSINDAAKVAGWLINTTRYASLSALKLRSRRHIHETKAAAMTPLVHQSPPSIEPPVQLDAVLDDALSRLGVVDRSAIALRYLQGKRVDEVGVALGISTDAAQKRISRGLEKLRGIFARRGITAPADALALGIAVHAAHHAPAELITIVTSQAAPAATLIAKGATTAMAAAHAKMLAACCAGALLIAGAAGTVATTTQTSARAAATTAPAAVAQAAPATAPSEVVTYPNHTFLLNLSHYPNKHEYSIGIDDSTKRTSDPAVIIASQTKEWGTIGTAMRGVDAAPFRGKRVRFSAYVKAKNLANWGSLWFFALGAENRMMANDDMGGRAMTGTSDWKKLEIVADIPPETLTILCGVQMRGAGQIWMDGAQIEVVSRDVPITDDQIWHAWSFSIPKYTVKPDPATKRNGKPTLLISSTTPGRGEWCMWDHIDRYPQKYLGKRMKMTCWIKTENITAPSGLRIRSMKGNGQYLDNDPGKPTRTIKGTTPWTRYELVADIAPDAFSVVSGIQMCGRGKLWVDDFQFEVLEPVK